MIGLSYLHYFRKMLAGCLALKAEMVQHREVVKEVAGSVDRSWVYYVTLMVAGLIALLGLLTNSVSVVIGAMLISPLMGPIISSSLAFTIGDLPLARRAFKTIAVSVALTIAVSAVVSFVSPLNEPTAEILARVRPNIFDLFIAVLSGIVGAVALCTKRNYLITTTGVAVATAVIPPLSVTGYGLGTGQPMLALGGFLLFFTNFVAIILSSDLVFFILGFRTGQAEAPKYSRRTSVIVTSLLLMLISIPLVYTLVVDLTKVKEKKRIERVLKRHLNKEQASRLTGYHRLLREGAKVRINASVNTVQLIDKSEERLVERELAQELKRPVDLRLEQVMVASGKALTQPKGLEVPGDPSLSAVETSSQVARLAAQAESELSEALAPFPVADIRLTFSGSGRPLLVSAKLRRDYQLSEDERLLLSRQLGRMLGIPVELAVTTFPLLPPLRGAGPDNVSAASTKELEIVKRLAQGGGGFCFRISSLRENAREARALKRYLTREFAVPARSLSLHLVSSGAAPPAGVALRIVRQQPR